MPPDEMQRVLAAVERGWLKLGTRYRPVNETPRQRLLRVCRYVPRKRRNPPPVTASEPSP